MDFVDIGLFASYLLVVLCALASILIPLIQSLNDLKSLLKSGLGVLILLVVFIASYVFSEGTAQGEVTASTDRLVGAGLVTTYVFFFAAVVGIIYTEVSKIVN